MRKQPHITDFQPISGSFGGYSPPAQTPRKVKPAQKMTPAVIPVPSFILSATPDNIPTSLLTKKIKSVIIETFADPPFRPASPQASAVPGAVSLAPPFWGGLFRGCGGTGRRAGFRSLWAQPRGGSTPLIRNSAFLPPRNRAVLRPGFSPEI